VINRLEVTVYLAAPLIFALAFTRQFHGGFWYDSVGRCSFILLAILGLSQFHNLLWPTSKLYQRLSNDEATANSSWLRYRIALYLVGATLFLLAIGLTLGGWLEYANALSINLALSVFSALFLFAAKTILAKSAAEMIRRTHLLDDLGRSSDRLETVRSASVRRYVARYSQAAYRGIDFLLIVCFTGINYWIWRAWLTLPPELLNFEIGGLALSGMVAVVKLLVLSAITIYFARELPSSLLWLLNQQTSFQLRNAQLLSRLISATVVYLGLWCATRVLDLSLPAIPWFGTLLFAGFLFGARGLIEDGLAGARILFDSRIAPGDTIEIGGRFGRVAAVNWFSTLVEDNLGSRSVVPNARIVKETVVKTRDEQVLPLLIEVSLPRHADAFQAQAVMMMVSQRDPAVIPEPPPHVRFLGFRMTEIRFEIRMLVLASEDVATTRQRIEQKLEVEFERHEVFGNDDIAGLRFERDRSESSARAG
jgi:small-conductance mechanosensitive channel